MATKSSRDSKNLPQKFNYKVESVQLMLFVQCVFEHDNQISIVPASYVRYDKKSKTHIQAKHMFDFDRDHRYQVKWYNCNRLGRKCDDESCRHEFSEWPAKLKVLGETPIAVQRNAKKLRRIRFVPSKLKKSTSESDSVANNSQQKCNELLQIQKEKQEAKLASSQHESRKQLDIWNTRHSDLWSTAQQIPSTFQNIPQTCAIPQLSAGDVVLSAKSTVEASIDTSCKLFSQDNMCKISKPLNKISSNPVTNDIQSMDTPNKPKSMKRLKSSSKSGSTVTERRTIHANFHQGYNSNSRIASPTIPGIPSTSTHQYSSMSSNRGTIQNTLHESDVDQYSENNMETDPARTSDHPQELVSTTSRSNNDYMKMVLRHSKAYEFDPRAAGGEKRPVKRRSALVVNAITTYKDKRRPEYNDYRKRYKLARGMAQLGQGVAAHPISLGVMELSESPEKFLKSLVLHYFSKDELAEYSFEPEQVPQKCWIPGKSQPRQFPKDKLDLILSIYDDFLHKKFDDQHEASRVRYLLKAVDDMGRWMRRERQRLREASCRLVEGAEPSGT
ncbi:hypothetical protein QAD02_022502 [Eretmocerus hayati]|uniref:Uncharacterized protein n=1 Tax=Eretmocerus hayati TaxID=131215 RepID=A0ACC2PT91_9HYME|nr:hypothetical protein QAD02_022502 [Eretmocerus hayati]